MLFDTRSLGMMHSSLEGLSVQQQVILHNLANLDTPGYKAKYVSFEDTLKGAGDRYDLKAHVITDEATSIRPDGNNVDSDTQSMALYQNYVQQLYLYQKISGQFTTLIVLHRDAPGTIAHVTELLGSNGINIANFRLAREQKGGTAVMTIEIDGDAGKELNRQVAALENVLGSTMLKPI